ncbi:hypothetical protein IE81DRAFT_348869 [Ceraceosorus guamensis]|uniref:Uncharacterized protein n=1 Tax=Ceraceosorus guamensis TaxID=1522189 RepID=A0A316VWN0_9BASI|nr:hypothetical protein IE81DRAFT_348869 [Ceraceosorus guamensis]PWN40853.1 hypothetical protein IE81DRAFT_348869 [Ceraceosorus guamensis]
MNHKFVETVQCGNLVVIQQHATIISKEEEMAELTQERNDAYDAYALADEKRIELQTQVKDAQNRADWAIQQFEDAHEGYQRSEAKKSALETENRICLAKLPSFIAKLEDDVAKEVSKKFWVLDQKKQAEEQVQKEAEEHQVVRGKSQAEQD